jgi:hypothetical protein
LDRNPIFSENVPAELAGISWEKFSWRKRWIFFTRKKTVCKVWRRSNEVISEHFVKRPSQFIWCAVDWPTEKMTECKNETLPLAARTTV